MEKAIFYPFLMFVFAISMIGGWVPTVKLLSQTTFRLVISFCAGILLGAVFFHILPEIATVLESQLGYSIMFGFLLIFVLEKFIMVHPCEEGECNYHKVGLAAYVGIGLWVALRVCFGRMCIIVSPCVFGRIYNLGSTSCVFGRICITVSPCVFGRR